MDDHLVKEPCWRTVAVCIVLVSVYMFCVLSLIHGYHIDIPVEEEPIVYQDQWEPNWEGISIKADQEVEVYLYSQRI